MPLNKEFWVKNKKLIIGIAIVIFALIVVSIIFKILKNRKRRNEFKSDYDNLINSGQKPSYPETSYLQMADKIYESGCPYGAATGCYGTDEEAIVETFNSMNNELDVLLLVRAFGSRAPRGTYWSDNVDLGGYLLTEIDSDDLKSINNTLSLKGINYKF